MFMLGYTTPSYSQTTLFARAPAAFGLNLCLQCGQRKPVTFTEVIQSPLCLLNRYAATSCAGRTATAVGLAANVLLVINGVA
jgi:hypothetical protein